MLVALKLLLTVTSADFISGLVHWLEDAYAHPHMRWVGGIARENLQHHARPREFLKKSWWESSYDLVLLGIIFLVLMWHAGRLDAWVALFAALVVNANQLHKWTHTNRQETPSLIRALQRRGILQDARHHALHHRGQRDSHYCVMTSYLNPVLERLQFWKRLEAAVTFLTGVKRRDDEQYLTRQTPSSAGPAQ